MGDGNDTISASGAEGLDVLHFGEKITEEKLKLKKSGNDLVITVSAGKSGDQITLQDWYKAGNESIRLDTLNFADGSAVSLTDKLGLKRVVKPTDVLKDLKEVRDLAMMAWYPFRDGYAARQGQVGKNHHLQWVLCGERHL